MGTCLTISVSRVRELERQLDQLRAELTKNSNGPIPDQQSLPTPVSNPTTGKDPIVSTDVNRYTNGVEYYGSTSNPQVASPGIEKTPQIDNFYFKQAQVFINAYFENLHFIHPIVDKQDFLARSGDMWFGRTSPNTNFRALYYSLLSLGALARVWNGERLDGLTQFDWSRKLFAEAQSYLNELVFPNDLDAVQALYLMAVVSQNMFIPHMEYMFLGLAIRACLSAGFNRELSDPNYQHSAISKTWWGIFSLEIEMSFSLGRSDTLGMDACHNRRLPKVDNSETAIIPLMVDFAQIIRRVSSVIHHTRSA